MLKDFTKSKFDIIVQAGQSNAEGSGIGDAAAPYLPNDRVWQMSGDFTMTKACECAAENWVVGNFVHSFAKEYIQAGYLAEGRNLLILKTAVGGTGFVDKRWGLNDDLFLRMMDMTQTALSLNPENRLVAFLWHQGETDAIGNVSYETHFQNLTQLLNTFRTQFHCPDLPAVAGDFVQQWKQENPEICRPIIRAIRDVFCGSETGAFAETDGLLSNEQIQIREDTIHFSRPALYELGKRYFNAYQSLCK